jgi:hypothetical protein
VSLRLLRDRRSPQGANRLNADGEGGDGVFRRFRNCTAGNSRLAAGSGGEKHRLRVVHVRGVGYDLGMAGEMSLDGGLRSFEAR